MCTVRVNNREYSADREYASEEMARNAAATHAYLICRNFSMNDGMYPGDKHSQGGVIQGLPVAIGTGRRRTYSTQEEDQSSNSYASGGSSPLSSGSGLDAESRRSSKSSQSLCYCGRGMVQYYERCSTCLRECGCR
ncbi:hypothetical protein P152DRAFT_456958 [Eremomyces bilateralis CBS 781.70]|uniref:DRBM domain-containing protein n=1 Tax=Eremomyces bilateralis CBS 781.70 TaxID=1392243 RepID=A0A6G1G6L8_9PEZI|nr:uncharacterized protein P152DRAFT_456958 [Eremomyces bilateralis CBS 781.70]KAF1813576.1 hypothetical protein P152DRAFT_456958 [Eremomyces bilateralis CBS 781.70]